VSSAKSIFKILQNFTPPKHTPSMENPASVTAAFTQNGTEVPQKLVQKCIEVCNQLNISAEDLASQHEAFTLNQKSMDSDLLTSSSLEKLRVHVKRTMTQRKKKEQKSNTFRRQSNSKPMYNKNTIKPNFNTPSPLKRNAPNSNTSTARASQGGTKKTRVGSEKDVGQLLLMQSTYKTRKNRGQLVGKVYNAKALMPAPEEGGAATTKRCQIQLISKEQSKWCADPTASKIAGGAMHMYTSPSEKADILEDRLHDMSQHIIDNHNLDPNDLGVDAVLEPVGMPSQTSVLVCGRLCTHVEGNDGVGSLNEASLLLEGSRARSNGVRVRLDVQKLAKFDLYPGQIVIVRGTTNANGSEMIAEDIYENGSPLMNTSSVSDLRYFNSTVLLEKPVEMLVASGPFCVVDNLEYEPLDDFADVVVAKKPDVVVLIGPFVDTTNTKIQLGSIELDDGEGGMMPVTYADLFRFRVTAAVERILGEVPGCQVLIVPSSDDAHHQCTYPQPKFDLDDLLYEGCDRDLIQKGVTLLPNPSVFKINGKDVCVEV
jgi:DNA polymerase alpha subunit B